MELEIKRIGCIGTGQVFERFLKGVEEANRHGTRLILSAVADIAFPEALPDIPKFGLEPGWAGNPDPDKMPPVMEFFLKEVDAVYIASPNNTHAGYIRCALSRKKHVLCTKPLTESFTTSNKLKARLKNYKNMSFEPEEKRQLLFMYEDHYLYYDISITLFGNQKTMLKKIVRNLGRPLFVEACLIEKAGASRTEPERARWLLNPAISGGGVWIDTGIHIIRLLHQFGAEIKVSSAFAELAVGYKAERKMVVTAKLEVRSHETGDRLIRWNQTPCLIHVEKDAQNTRKEINIYFEQGLLTLNFAEGKIVREYQGQVSTICMPSNHYRNIASVFYNLIAMVKDERLAGLSDAIQDLKVVKEVYQEAGLKDKMDRWL